jgi:2-oxo-3-hexenedioate decarboxylase
MQKSSAWDTFPEDIREIATTVQDARVNNYQIHPISKTVTDLDHSMGYHIAASLKALREETGEVVAGRKIGFSNRNIWPEYNINESNWSYTYKDGLIDLTEEGNHERLSYESGIAEVDISHLSNLQPRIEPEVVLGLAYPVNSSMGDATLLASLEWIAHGYEIVASIYPDWKFTAADTTAAFALHGLLLIGPKIYVQEAASRSPERLLENLTNFRIELRQNGKTVDEGVGSNVLGSPIKALRHLT